MGIGIRVVTRGVERIKKMSKKVAKGGQNNPR